MTEMTASCIVTVRPTITAERVEALSRVILDRLWPGNAGGVHVLFGRKMVDALQAVAAEARARNAPATFRVRRTGIRYVFEPVDPVHN